MRSLVSHVFFLVLLVLASFVVDAAVDLDPKQVGSGLYNISMDWTVKFGSQLPDEATLATFGFLETADQRVTAFWTDHPYTTKTDTDGNPILEFTFTPHTAQEVIRLNALVRVDAEGAAELSGSGLTRYLSESPYVSIDPDLLARTIEVTDGANTTLEKAVLLTEWVHNYVTYDGPGYGASVQTARWVYTNKVGTCDEFAHLLLAMLRGAGIPARFVAGIVYTGEVWGLHAWVEASIDNRWVPLDPTYGEAGEIDATHIVFSRGADQEDIKSEIRARALASSGFVLDGTEISPNPSVTIVQTANFTPNRFSLTLHAPLERVGEGSLETVTVTVSGSRKSRGVPLALIRPPQLRVVGDATRIVLVQAGQSRNISWNVVVPSALEEGFVYRYPLRAVSMGVIAEGLLEAQKGGNRTVGPRLLLRDLRSLVEGKDLVVRVEVTNAGNAPFVNGTVSLRLGSFEENRSIVLESGQQQSLEFRVPDFVKEERLEGVFLFQNEQLQQRQSIAIVFPTSTPTQIPIVSTPAASLIPVGVPELFLPGLSQSQVLTLAAVGAVLVILSLALLWRRRLS